MCFASLAHGYTHDGQTQTKHKAWTKEQMFLALGGMASLAMIELFAVSTGLWNYTPGNWPVILWPTYFVAILFGYQLLRSIERLLLRRPLMNISSKRWTFKKIGQKTENLKPAEGSMQAGGIRQRLPRLFKEALNPKTARKNPAD